MDRSVRQSVDPVRRGVHGPGVSVFGSPILNSALRCVGAVKNSLDIHSLPWGARCDSIKQCFAKYHCFLAEHYRN